MSETAERGGVRFRFYSNRRKELVFKVKTNRNGFGKQRHKWEKANVIYDKFQ